ncbi:hypothetical protein RHSIM_RhsimUnG0246300 [Rhododendron simsii]|uniref:R13L1/DRL21-like LRR repeat region domain-containing protein n=1 Tax=Rhododendron simsii TaxID=118357 RepID=A0A834FT93_RHOSS|nr:hypothetical protein RHSIM_RhsimUnG0246300 [Rhododendron simsii]
MDAAMVGEALLGAVVGVLVDRLASLEFINFFRGDQSFCSMVSLCLENCKNCFSLPPLGQMPSFKEFTIARMPGITNVGREFYGETSSLSKLFPSLEALRFEDMSGWVDWCILDSEEFSRLQKLEEYFYTQPSVDAMPRGTVGMVSMYLEGLTLDSCESLESLPLGGIQLQNLSSLWVRGCEKLKALPEQMHTLQPSLQTLVLGDCLEIESFPEGGLPSRLTSLGIYNCKKLIGGRRDWGLQTLPSLTFFSLSKDEDVLESFPEEGLLPPTLTFLRFGDLPNLKSLNFRGLQLLGSLETLFIWNCPQLQSLPEEGLPTSLLNLKLEHCPLLKPRCRREEGEDW